MAKRTIYTGQLAAAIVLIPLGILAAVRNTSTNSFADLPADSSHTGKSSIDDGSVRSAPVTSRSVADLLAQEYTVTKVDADGHVIEPGAIVHIGLQILKANPIYGDRYEPNFFKKDFVSHPAFRKPSMDNLKVADSMGNMGPEESVFITGIDVAATSVTFKLQTFENRLTRPLANTPYRAALAFQFSKGVTDNSRDIDDIEKKISEVLVVESRPHEMALSAETRVEDSSRTAAARGNDIIHLGESQEQIKNLLGTPDQIQGAGGKVVFLYPGLRITFVNGRVTAVDQ